MTLFKNTKRVGLSNLDELFSLDIKEPYYGFNESFASNAME